MTNTKSMATAKPIPNMVLYEPSLTHEAISKIPVRLRIIIYVKFHFVYKMKPIKLFTRSIGHCNFCENNLRSYLRLRTFF